MDKRVGLVGTIVVVAALVLGACTAQDAVDDAGSAMDDIDAVSGGERDAVQEEVAEGAADRPDADVGEAPPGLPADVRGTDGRHVILDGSMTITYESTFDRAFREVAAVAEGLGGGVTGVTSETTDEGVTVGEVTVRVPVDAYDRLLLDVADIGEPLRRHITEEDVTGEVVDLQSRLRHLERQETFYLGLFDDAEGVSDAITIQEHLQQVQQRIEELQGRLDHLEDRTSMSTLRVEMVPEGHEGITPRTAGFAGYWEDAVDAFVRVTGTLLVLAFGAAPLLFVGALLLGVVVLLVRAWRTGEAAPAAPDA